MMFLRHCKAQEKENGPLRVKKATMYAWVTISYFI